MKRTQKLPQIILRILGFGMGLISILGGIAALWGVGEPERYLVSAVILFCGGECGCFQYRGYPGYWLKGSTCVTNRLVPIRMSTWQIDTPSLVADVVFWIDTGLIISLLGGFPRSKLVPLENKG